MVKNAVILAGGSGTRLWPASRAAMPKQYLRFGETLSLFQQTLERVRSLRLDGSAVVVTHRDQRGQIVRQWEEMGRPVPLVLLEEPAARNTAPAITYAACYLEQTGGADTRMLVLSSDHLIDPPETFRADVERADAMAREGSLVTFGIQPREPSTGYGYIEAGDPHSTGYRVVSFHEKPDSATAESYLRSRKFFWNAGIFTFPVSLFLRAMQIHAADVADPFRDVRLKLKSRKGLTSCTNLKSVERFYEALPSISIDCALMERTSEAGMVPASFRWSDVGSWDEVRRLYPEGRGEVFRSDAAGSFVYSDIPVALAGVRDLTVIIRNGTALICRKGRSQSVRDIVRKLKSSGRSDLL